MPSEYRSDLASTGAPRACSGERYCAVPTIDPASVICDAPPELLVLREVDVGHPAGAELAPDDVAPVEDAVQQGVGGGHTNYGFDFDAPGRIACISAFAIGAET